MNCWLKLRRHRFTRNGRDHIIDLGRNKMFGITCSKCGRDTVFFLGSRQPRYCANPENGGEDG